MATPQLPAVQQPLTPAEPFRYYGLRTKFVAFFSVILILSCSALSWHFIENRRDTTRLALKETGLILLTNLVSNQHFRYAGLIAEDRGTLEEFLGGLKPWPSPGAAENQQAQSSSEKEVC